jgi:anti-sigma factor RsiW
MTAANPIVEEELHAWLDGRLADERRPAVEAYLREHPEEAERLEAYRADGTAIARIFSLDQVDLPPHPVDLAVRRSSFGARWWQAAAALVLIGIGAAAGWSVRAHREATPTERLAHNAAAAYLILGSPGAQLVTSTSLDDLSRKLSGVLGVSIKLRDPNSSGYSIAAVRVVPQAKTSAVQIVMHGSTGDTVTFYIEARPGATETPMWHTTADGLTALVWEDDDVACAIIGTLAPDKLEQVGRKVYEALLG